MPLQRLDEVWDLICGLKTEYLTSYDDDKAVKKLRSYNVPATRGGGHTNLERGMCGLEETLFTPLL